MTLLQHPIQRKISAMIGADVSFEHLNISLLGGSVDARGVRVVTAPGDAEPLLTVKRVRVELALAKALRGEIVVKSVTLERPILTVLRDADGTLNLPKRLEADPDEEAAEFDVEADARADDGTTPSSGKSRRVVIEKVLVVDGEIHYRDAGVTGGFHVSAGRVLLDLARSAGGFDVTVILESVGRRDVKLELGTVRLNGRLDGMDDVTRLAESSLSMDLDVAGHLRATVTSPRLSDASFAADVDGAIDLATLRGVLPKLSDLSLLVTAEGRVAVKGNVSYDRTTGLRVPTLTMTATDVGGIGRSQT